ncbi:hypothetical protein AYI68_g5909, partial [Smittium mucronatum]
MEFITFLVPKKQG